MHSENVYLKSNNLHNLNKPQADVVWYKSSSSKWSLYEMDEVLVTFLRLVHVVKQTIAAVLRFVVVAGWETAPVAYYCEELPSSVSGSVRTLVVRRPFQGFDVTGPLYLCLWFAACKQFVMYPDKMVCVSAQSFGSNCKMWTDLSSLQHLKKIKRRTLPVVWVAMPNIHQQVEGFHNVTTVDGSTVCAHESEPVWFVGEIPPIPECSRDDESFLEQYQVTNEMRALVGPKIINNTSWYFS